MDKWMGDTFCDVTIGYFLGAHPQRRPRAIAIWPTESRGRHYTTRRQALSNRG